MSHLTQKIRSVSGETLVETLASIVIVAVVFMFLTTALVTSLKVSTALTNDSGAYSTSGRVADGEAINISLQVEEPVDGAIAGTAQMLTVQPYKTPYQDGAHVYHDYEYTTSSAS